MQIKCEYIGLIRSGYTTERDVIIDLCNVDYYHFYMNNDIERILDEVPNEEIEKYLQDQRNINEKN